ncbi:hypothetical protein TYRP_021138 [Tyrophagus putrescentiae]|nr:hypothetical protein TYRP_021138 [Tyrophagus putrescentiae]
MRISVANEIANLEINRVDCVERLQRTVSEMCEQSVMTFKEPTEENHQKLQYTTARMKAHLNLFQFMINNLSEQFAKFEKNQRSRTASQVDDEVEKVGDQQSLDNPHLLTVPTGVGWICRLELAPHFVVHHYEVIHRKKGIVGEKLSVVQLGRNNSLTVFDVPTAKAVHVPM